jgi:magnesium-transporting ATPase (P-type)
MRALLLRLYSYQMAQHSADDTDDLVEALEQFATEGLRTLVITKREIEPSFSKTWLQEYSAARNAVGDREQRLAEVAQKIEELLEALGATAIEDRLQVRVRGSWQSAPCCTGLSG